MKFFSSFNQIAKCFSLLLLRSADLIVGIVFVSLFPSLTHRSLRLSRFANLFSCSSFPFLCVCKKLQLFKRFAGGCRVSLSACVLNPPCGCVFVVVCLLGAYVFFVLTQRRSSSSGGETAKQSTGPPLPLLLLLLGSVLAVRKLTSIQF